MKRENWVYRELFENFLHDPSDEREMKKLWCTAEIEYNRRRNEIRVRNQGRDRDEEDQQCAVMSAPFLQFKEKRMEIRDWCPNDTILKGTAPHFPLFVAVGGTGRRSKAAEERRKQLYKKKHHPRTKFNPNVVHEASQLKAAKVGKSWQLSNKSTWELC